MGGDNGDGNGMIRTEWAERDQETGKGRGLRDQGGHRVEEGEKVTIGWGCVGVLGVLCGGGRQSGLDPISLGTVVIAYLCWI